MPPNKTPPCPKSILIVDDNVDAAEALGELLKISGHHVHIAHDGASALEQASRLQPEVMILDIGMPMMNGYEIAQSIRSTTGLCPPMLIAVTGYAQEGDLINAYQAGFDHHFAKPLDVSELAAILGSPRAAP